MKIAGYQMALNASSNKTSFVKQSVVQSVIPNALAPSSAKKLSNIAQSNNNGSIVQKKDEQPKKTLTFEALEKMSRGNKATNAALDLRDYRIKLFEQLVALLSGKKLPKNNVPIENNQINSFDQGSQISGRQQTITVLETISYERYENESASFSASGTVQTSDGREINIDLELNMSRELYEKFEQTSVASITQNFCDPLVLNFSANTAELSDMKFSFDLDCDGTSDQISNLMSGSGFLALDKNGDGTINDGNELFGAKSGNGFTDLALYDQDGNGWIDENDDVFDKLRIWVKDENGKDTLFGLGEKGVGAIYLGNVSTQFSLHGNSGAVNGMLQRTGIFLNENGSAGTIQHVDMAL